ncbi:MAG: 6-phosphogluconolactonase [Bdellovibrionales bacterium]|nr:6-phosphogluconolactonase [Bdellovibrionales bacterium]
MTAYLGTSDIGATAIKRSLGARVRQLLQGRSEQKTAVFVTGGRSVDFWLVSLLECGELLNNVGFFLTDTFDPSDALAEGRSETNEENLLASGFAEAISKGVVRRDQLFLPDHQTTSLDELARAYSDTLIEFRGEATADLIFLSSGGGSYTPNGPEDPGHCAGLPHGRSELLDSEIPFIALEGMPKPPSRRVTMTPRLMRTASQMYLFVLGSQKANALKNIKARRPLSKCPACIVHEVDDSYVVTDLE